MGASADKIGEKKSNLHVFPTAVLDVHEGKINYSLCWCKEVCLNAITIAQILQSLDQFFCVLEEKIDERNYLASTKIK